MAKAKKSDAGDAAAPKAVKKTTGGAGKGKATGGKAGGPKPAAGPAGVPQIDTNLAASAAAAMILSRAVTGGGVSTSPPSGGGGGGASSAAAASRESAGFKQLKQDLNKPTGTAGGLGGVLGNAAQQKKGNQPSRGPKQVGRNQTFGADVNRSGVPRRTGG